MAEISSFRKHYYKSCECQLKMYRVYKLKNYIFHKNVFALIQEQTRFKWKASDKLGTGAFGIVFKAVDSETGTDVAVKEINWPKKKTVQDDIIKETEILSKLHHKNIAKMVKAFRHSKRSEKVYIAMELCSGGELFDIVVERAHLTEESAKKVTKEMLSALVYCHEMQVAHLDLKPENIILSEKANKDKSKPLPPIKLIDWGLSSEFKDFNTCPLTCRTKGTPAYIAPEVFSGYYNEKADLWSVGVIVMVLLTGEYPYNDPLPIDKNGDFIRDENGHWVSVLPTEDDISALEFRSGSGMSVESLAFIKKLLTVSPASRPSAAEALKDPWFASGHVSTGVVSPRVINNIRNLLQKTNF